MPGVAGPAGHTKQALGRPAFGEAGAEPVVRGLPPGVEAVRRRAFGARAWLFVVNHTTEPVRIRPAAPGLDLLTGVATTPDDTLTVPGGGSAACAKSS